MASDKELNTPPDFSKVIFVRFTVAGAAQVKSISASNTDLIVIERPGLPPASR